MKSKLFTLILVVLLMGGITYAATISVAADTNAISTAYAAATEGDVLELTTDGGVYQETAVMVLDKGITIRGADGLAAKPIIRCSVSGDYIFKVTASSPTIVFDNVEVDGSNGSGSASSKYFLRLDTGDSTGTMNVSVLNSVVHDFTDKHIKPYPNTGIASLTVDNSVFYGGASEGIVLYSGTSSDDPVYMASASITNSTFYDFEREAIKGQTYPLTNVLVDRCTFYNLGENDKKAMIYFRDMDNVVVKNSIFSNNNNADAEKFADFESAVSQFNNNVIWATTNYEVGNATVGDTLVVDPGFTDVASADFTLPLGSALLTFADDGGAVGDPRWVPESPDPVTYEIAAGTDILSATYASAKDGDTIELTTDGGVYQETGVIVMDKGITIRGADGLAAKPIIRCDVSGDYIFKVTASSPTIVFDNVEVDGSNGTGTASSKYFLRIETGDTTGTMDLSVLNCVVHDFTDKHIKPYPLTGMSSLVIDNSVFYGGASEGIVLYSGTSSDDPVHLASASITNSTFYDFEREAIKGQTYPNTTVLVDRCTFYNIGENDKKAMIYFRDMENVVVKNSIFSTNNNTDAEKFADFESNVSQFTNNIVWATTNFEVGNATVGDTLVVDPGFADVAAADFTLPLGSALLTFADDGGAVGDPRWVPGAEVIQIAEGTDVLSTAYAAAAEGSVLELSTSGGVYQETGVIIMDKGITIRGADGLAAKPIIRCDVSGDYIFKVTASSPTIVFDNVEVDGSNGTGTASSKYFLRIETGDTTGTMDLSVLNCVVHDFTDKHIKPYPLTGMSSLVVDNSVFYGGASEGIVLYSGSSSDDPVYLASASITNSTFYDFEREAIKGQTYPHTTVLVDRCTFYNLGENDKKAMIYFRDMENVVVKNSIFSSNNNADAEKFADFESSVSLFHNNVVWATTNFAVGNATVSDTMVVDPGFADVASADFTLPLGSALLTFADDGGAVGDPRWVPADGWYTLTAYTDGSGTVTKTPDLALYEENTVVNLVATPDEYWQFDTWSDNVVFFDRNNPDINITMTENIAVTAYFSPTLAEYTVDTSSVGLGHIELVNHSDFGLDGFYDGDSLVLTPVADTTTWEFAYWIDGEGDSLTNVVPLTYVVHADTAFTAMFRSTITQYALDLTVTGMGDVEIDPLPVEGFETYDSGTEITLMAETSLGWAFDGYSGDVVATTDTVVFTLDADKDVEAIFSENSHADGNLAIDVTWELLDAIEYAENNSQVNTIVLTDLGPYQPSEDLRNDSDGKMPPITIESPIRIVADEALAEKPVIRGYTSSSSSSSSEGFFRIRSGAGTLELKNLVIDGHLDQETDKYKAKYIFRADDSSDTIRCSIKAYNVDFSNTIEAFWKNYALAYVDTMVFEDCHISKIGKEGIYMKSVGHANYVELKNTTFTKVGRDIIYLTNLPETSVKIDHVTIADCGYGTGSESDNKYPAFRIENITDAQISNVIIYNVTNTVYNMTLRFYGENSLMDNVLLYNTPTSIDNDGGATVGTDVFWYDPMFVGPDTGNYTLADSSLAYHMAGDGSVAIGDLRWATSSNIVPYYTLDMDSGEHGSITQDPMPILKFYEPGTVVTLTANADTLYKFSEWGGDASGTANPTTVTMDADKSITATFLEAWYNVELNVNMGYWTFLQKFDPASDSVDVAGDFVDSASELWMDDSDGDSIYTATVMIDENFPNMSWKFRINGSDDAATCESSERTFTVTQDTSLTFWYNNDEPVVGVDGRYLPMEYALNQNYPNPFNPVTRIEFALVNPGRTKMVVYDIMGRQVTTLINKDLEAGFHSIDFRADRLASGVYFYRIESGKFTAIRKMVIVK